MSDSDSFHSQEDVEQNYEQGEFRYPVLQYISLRSLKLEIQISYRTDTVHN